MIEIKNSDDDNEYYSTIEDLFNSDFELKIDTDAVFYKNDKLYEKACENNYYGRYTFTFEYADGTKSSYDFVFYDKCKDVYGIEEMELLPVRLDDTKIFNYICDYDFEFNDEAVKSVTVDYVSCREFLAKVGKDELITYTGQIRKIHPSDIYEYNEQYDVNFQVIDEIPQEYLTDTLCMVDCDEFMLNNMENDNYMGKLKICYVTSIGMPLYIYADIVEVSLVKITYEIRGIRRPDPLNFHEIYYDDTCRLVQCLCTQGWNYIPYEELNEDVHATKPDYLKPYF